MHPRTGVLRWLPLAALAILSVSMLSVSLTPAHGFASSQSASLAIGASDFSTSVYPSYSFKVPSNFAFDSSGNVWVADSGNNRILEEPGAPAGVSAPLLVLGQAAVTAGLPAVTSTGIYNPSGVAFDSSGDLWFADTSNNRVLEYAEPLSTGEAATTVIGQPSFTSSSSGVSPSGLNTPANVAFDSSGDLWVADAGNNRVLEYAAPFTSGMAASVVIGQTSLAAGGSGSSADGLYYPTWAGFDPSGNLWVADAGNNRVLEYAAPFQTGMNASLVIGQAGFGTSANGTSKASLYLPDGLAFDSSGNIWVADGFNNRVLEFSAPLSSGMQASLVLGQQSFDAGQSDASATGMYFPSQVSIGPGGSLWVADSYNNRLLEFSAPFATGMAATSIMGQTDPSSNLYEGRLALSAPESVAFDSSGNLWAVDTNDNRVVEYSSPFSTGMAASLVLGQPDLNSGAGAVKAAGMNLPFFATFDASGDLWVSDSGSNRVLEFAPPFASGMNASLVIGQLTFATGTAQTTPSGFYYPAGLAFDPSGNLWVADAFNSRVLEFKAPFTSGMSASLVLGQSSFGTSSTGTSSSSLTYPVDLAFDSSGDLWVADAGNSRVVMFAAPFSSGEAASLVIGQQSLSSRTPATSQTGLYLPSSVAFDHAGNMWVGDEANNRVLEFTPPFSDSMPASVVLGQPDFGSGLPSTSASGLAAPLGIAFDSSNNLWLADSGNNRVLEYVAGTSATTSSATGTVTSSSSGRVTVSVTTPTFTATSTASTTSSNTSAVPEFPFGAPLAFASALIAATIAGSLLVRRRAP